jgi:holo-[acyl-carrier protein] synthase
MAVSTSTRRAALRAASLRVGTDLVEVEAVADSIRTFGERYLARIFTPRERRYCTDIAKAGGDAVPHFAARFAAKEAVIKLLRPSGSEAVAWRSIEVLRHPHGFCTVRLHGSARAHARRARLCKFAISLSHEARYALAVAVCEGRKW